MKNFNIEIEELYQSVKYLQNNGCVFQYYEDPEYDGRSVTIKNKELIHFANCSYLGLEKHPALIEGAVEAVRKYGTQNSMSRAMLSSPLYKIVEDNLKKIFPGHQLIFPTVTLAHCSALPALIGENDAIILDAYVHNSVRMASKLCKANGTFILISKHNNMEHVKYLIYRLKKKGYKNIWYCADGVYSIHGNLCDIDGLKRLLDEEENFYAYVDDAHGMGWCGENGKGYVIGHHGLHSKMIVAVSFNKSFAASGGGLILPDRELAEYIKFTGQTMIFSGPVHPPMLGVLYASTEFHLSTDLKSRQDNLNQLIMYFRDKNKELNLPIITNDNTPIQLLKIGDMQNTYLLQKKLINRGFLCTTAGYPAIAKGNEGIRVSLTNHLSKDDISAFLENLKEILVSEYVLK